MNKSSHRGGEKNQGKGGGNPLSGPKEGEKEKKEGVRSPPLRRGNKWEKKREECEDHRLKHGAIGGE